MLLSSQCFSPAHYRQETRGQRDSRSDTDATYRYFDFDLDLDRTIVPFVFVCHSFRLGIQIRHVSRCTHGAGLSVMLGADRSQLQGVNLPTHDPYLLVKIWKNTTHDWTVRKVGVGIVRLGNVSNLACVGMRALGDRLHKVL